jgi:hypothetical protein
LQLLAYYVATLKGTNVDQPRNLAKSVTVEWWWGLIDRWLNEVEANCCYITKHYVGWISAASSTMLAFAVDDAALIHPTYWATFVLSFR